MENCFENMRLEDLTRCVNEELVSGTSETEVYVAVSEHIDVFPEPVPLGSAALSLGSLATIGEKITFKETFGFFKLQAQTETGEVKSELVGNKGNKKVKNTYEFFLSGTSPQNIGFVRQYKNAPLVFLVREKSGRLRLIGSKALPAYFDEVSGTTGKGTEDDIGWQISVSTTSARPSLIYEGEIVLFGESTDSSSARKRMSNASTETGKSK